MERTRACRLALPVVLLAAIAAGTSTVEADEPDDVIVADRFMTPAAGALDLLTLQLTLAAVEDRVLPARLGGERQGWRVSSVLYRAAKLVLLDAPQDHMIFVMGHEVFGHGSRLRELGNGRITYSFDAPPPYGDGGAVTSFSGMFPATPLARLAVEMAGIEAQNVLADTLAERALRVGRFHYREAWLYFASRYAGFTYIRNASPDSSAGHDVADFSRTFEEACVPPSCDPVTLEQLRRGARLVLADPLLYVAAYGFAASYIGQGKTAVGIPMIPVGSGVRYLPAAGFQMTPYGIEWIARNTFAAGPAGGGDAAAPSRRISMVTLRVGTTGATRPWGVDLRTSELRIPFTRLRMSPSASLWRQPYYLAPQTSAPLETGAAVSGMVAVPLPQRMRSRWVSGVSIAAGYKSAGFIPGEQLSSGATFRVGLVVPRR